VLGVSLEDAGWYLGWIYWMGALIGRFIGSFLLMRVAASRLLAVAGAAACLLSLVAFSTTGPTAAYAALSVGLFNSIMFPTIFTLTLDRSTASSSSTSGLLCLAIVGGALLPLLSGHLADAYGVAMAFAVPAAAYVGIVLFALGAHRAGVAGSGDVAAPAPH
jgi:FHS family L-fucose permease-like MFS transporter